MVFSLKKNQPIRRAYDTYDSVSKRVFHIVATNTCLALYYKPTIGPKLYFSPKFLFVFVCVRVCVWVSVCVCCARFSPHFCRLKLLFCHHLCIRAVLQSCLCDNACVSKLFLHFPLRWWIFYVCFSFIWVFLKTFLKTGPDGPQFSLMYFSLNNSTSLKYSAFYALSSL